ncbi:MAG: nucleotidyl transferase AbiEii/AbiGii toxin family protein [Candidatus Humimicrobiaceae bacterium]
MRNQEFENILEAIGKDLSMEGFSAAITSERRKNLFIAKLSFTGIMQSYEILDGRGLSLMIKMEVNQPNWELNTDSKVISMYGYSFTAILMSMGNLISEKVCALLNRKRGRDIYDTLYMLRNKFPFNEKVLSANNIKLPIKDTIMAHLNTMDEKELKRMADQVKPFLSREDDIDLIIKAPVYCKAFLDDYISDV